MSNNGEWIGLTHHGWHSILNMLARHPYNRDQSTEAIHVNVSCTCIRVHWMQSESPYAFAICIQWFWYEIQIKFWWNISNQTIHPIVSSVHWYVSIRVCVCKHTRILLINIVAAVIDINDGCISIGFLSFGLSVGAFLLRSRWLSFYFCQLITWLATIFTMIIVVVGFILFNRLSNIVYTFR